MMLFLLMLTAMLPQPLTFRRPPSRRQELRELRRADQLDRVFGRERARVVADLARRHIDALVRVARFLRRVELGKRLDPGASHLPPLAVHERRASFLADLEVGGAAVEGA